MKRMMKRKMKRMMTRKTTESIMGFRTLTNTNQQKPCLHRGEMSYYPWKLLNKTCRKASDGNTIPTRFNNTRKEKESSERKVSIESIPRTDHKSFDNGGGGGFVMQRNTFINGNRFEALPREKGPIISKYSNVKDTNYTELVKGHHFKEVKENKRISEERRNAANAVTGKGIHTPDPKVKPSYQQRGQSKEDETVSSSPYGRDTGRYTNLNSSEPRRSAYVVYRTVTQKPKFSGSTAVPESYGLKGSKQKNQPDTNRRFCTQTENYGKYTSGSSNSPAWKKRNPQAKSFSKFKITTQQSKEDMEMNKKGEKETSKWK
uniref:Uncharacterized protein n=1 Tax=Taeniopygia guttata TaxID=59729 RepID=A0A674HQ70_TAEGU